MAHLRAPARSGGTNVIAAGRARRRGAPRPPFALALLCLVATACAALSGRGAVTPTRRAFDAGPSSNDADVVGRWLLAESLAPGGTASGAARARQRLDRLDQGGGRMLAPFAAGLDDASHGRFRGAPARFVAALEAARERPDDPTAPLVAWVSASHLLALASATPETWTQLRPRVERLLAEPGAIGWRARGELVDWWSNAAMRQAEPAALERTADLYGCARALRLAGPFGRNVPSDQHRSFAAERPGPWPAAWEAGERDAFAPRQLRVERQGCLVRADEPVRDGLFYAETYLEAPAERDVIVAVQGALAVWVDDRLVLERDTRVWGVWPKFGARVRLGPGRHRLLARVGDPETSVRVLRPDGAPSDVRSVTEPGGAYGTGGFVTGADPNVLGRYLDGGRLEAPRDELEAFLAAYVAQLEGQADVASVLVEPLVDDRAKATGLALATAANYAEKDPIYPPNAARDTAKLLRQRAAERDPKLWWPRLWLAAEAADRGLGEVTADLEALSREFPEVPEVGRGLIASYGKLGWKGERVRAARAHAERFPNDRATLELAVGVYEELGDHARADALAARLKRLYPDSEIELDRALARRDYATAAAELKRLAARRPDRKDLAERVLDLRQRSGEKVDPFAEVELALRRNPRDPAARLALADARYAAGDRSALRTALAAALEQGLPTDELRSALELVEGMTALEPYRLDGRKLVREFETSRVALEGTAARLLDYAVLWIKPDGSARMLEHELIRVQSQEAVGSLTEQQIPRGALALRLRVLKKDGRVFEPEQVEGKPTATMPYLEVGDYLEIERILPFRGDGEGGKRYLSPQWFFREAEVAYWRSEFVVVSPKERPLVVQSRGPVPPPAVSEVGGRLVVRRWRVDQSPAAPVERGSVPVTEFLPSVTLGWGVTLEGQLERARETVGDELPRDPRLVRLARTIVAGAPEGDARERARRLYRWVLTNVEDNDQEGDGRRVVTGRSGRRGAGFLYLARALGLPVEIAAVRNRLTPPEQGPIDAALAYQNVAIRLAPRAPCPRGADCAPLWFTVGDRYAPFGYLPAELRGQPAVVLDGRLSRAQTPSGGAPDGIVYEGEVDLRADGSASVAVDQRFVGLMGIRLRGELEKTPEPRLVDVVEGNLVARALPGSRLAALKVEDRDDLDRPLTLKMRVEVPNFARVRGRVLIFKAPFSMLVGPRMAALESRQTPLLLPEATHSEVRLQVRLPAGARVEGDVGPAEARDGERFARARDALAPGGALVIDRTLDVPAGRVAVDEYARFRRFASDADELALHEFAVRLP
jgi:tetratricopeptide (TPR) repeat protein